MFRRFILFVIFVIVAFYVYRGIHPTGAEALIEKVQNIFGGDTTEEIVVEELTWDIEEVITGEIPTGNDLGLFDDIVIEELTGDTIVTPSTQADEVDPEVDTPSEPIVVPTQEVKTETTSTPSTLQLTQTNTEIQDTQNLINSLFK